VDWLDYNGFAVVTKPAKEFTDSQGRRRIKGNMDIELAIDVMEMAEQVDHIVIFSGDGDFRRLVEAAQRKGRRVSIVSTIAHPAADGVGRASPPMRQFHRARRPEADNHPVKAARAPCRRMRNRNGADSLNISLFHPDLFGSSIFLAVKLGRPHKRAIGWLRGDRISAQPEPPLNCPLCPRLAAFRAANRMNIRTISTTRCQASDRSRRGC
jgi:hypothetical protein